MFNILAFKVDATVTLFLQAMWVLRVRCEHNTVQKHSINSKENVKINIGTVRPPSLIQSLGTRLSPRLQFPGSSLNNLVPRILSHPLFLERGLWKRGLIVTSYPFVPIFFPALGQEVRLKGVREPRTATGSWIFSILEHLDAITFVTSNHRRPSRAFPVRYEEQKRIRKGKIRLPVAARGSQTSAELTPTAGARWQTEGKNPED